MKFPARRPLLRVLPTLSLLLASVTGPSTPSANVAAGAAVRPARRAAIAFARAPVRFEPNLGQADARVRFTARTREGALFLTAGEAVVRLGSRERGPAAADAVLRIAVDGADARALASATELLPGVTNYFVGDDPSTWRTNVPGYARARFEGVYPGVDLVYYGNDGRLEYDFVCAPGADPSRIALRIDGAQRVAVDVTGDLVLTTAVGEVRQHAPRVYQDIAGVRHAVAGGYELHDGKVGFALAGYDASRDLVIDPELVYATYLGGSATTFVFPGEAANAIAADAAGCAYVVGTTASPDFPIVDALQPHLGGDFEDAFVTKLGADGSLVYSTYLGGRGNDYGLAVAVDGTGAAYVVGQTGSGDFPTRNAVQGTHGGVYDAFLTKLAPDGAALVYSTFYGGSGIDEPAALCLRPDSVACMTGWTESTDLRTVEASQPTYGGGPADGFIAVVSADGSALTFSTYFGGSGTDLLTGCLVAGEHRRLFVSGLSDSADLPFVTSSRGGPLPGPSGVTPPVASLDSIGDGPVYHSPPYVSVPEFPNQTFEDKVARTTMPRPAFDPDGRHVDLHDLIVALGGFFRPRSQVTNATVTALGGVDVHLLVLDPESLAQRRLVSFGGSGQDYPADAALGPQAEIYVTGDTSSLDLPTVEPVQSTLAGGEDAFAVAFAPGSLTVAFATYLGGPMDDRANAVAADPQGNIYICGWTYSEDFPVTPGAADPSLRGFSDPWVAKISAVGPFAPDFAISVDPSSLTARRGQKGELAVRVDRVASFDGRVTVTAPDAKAIKVKLTPASGSTTGDAVSFAYKVKKKAQPGTYTLVFSGRDDGGRERTAALTLVVQ
jgi:hypothetical protein